VFPETMSANARDFIENLIKKNPNERIKSYKLLQHPFLVEDSKKEERKIR
jgi:serine/threonine protein kinase